MNISQALERYGPWGTLLRGPRKVARLARRAFYKGMKFTTSRTEYGVLMHSNWGDETFEMCFSGSYGNTLSRLLKQRRAPFVFLDVGANQGLYSLLAARNPKCEQVYAFEPVASTVDLLRENIRINGMQERITTIPLAISDHTGDGAISVDSHHSGVASLNHIVGRETQVVGLTTVEDIAARISPADLPLVVKVDVEGHEQVVIAQLMASSLASRVSVVFYEVDEEWCDPERLSTPLVEAKFRLRHVGSGTHYDVLAVR